MTSFTLRPKSERPTKQKYKMSFDLTAHPDIREWLEKRSQETELTRGEIIRTCIRYAMDADKKSGA